MRTVANALVELSKEARTIFLQEPRLLKLKAPTYVLGEFLNTVKLCNLWWGKETLISFSRRRNRELLLIKDSF
jgi:hypothetical protein